MICSVPCLILTTRLPRLWLGLTQTEDTRRTPYMSPQTTTTTSRCYLVRDTAPSFIFCDATPSCICHLTCTSSSQHNRKYTLDFPEVVANLIIDGVSHDITPESNTNTNPWDEAITASRHNDTSKTQTEHLKDFSTWSVRFIYCVDVGSMG